MEPAKPLPMTTLSPPGARFARYPRVPAANRTYVRILAQLFSTCQRGQSILGKVGDTWEIDRAGADKPAGGQETSPAGRAAASGALTWLPARCDDRLVYSDPDSADRLAHMGGQIQSVPGRV